MKSPGQCIAVVSGKGGTGKTSFTAGVGAALAQSGRRVLCLDCDIGLRNLDLALGLSDRTLMDFSDVAQGRCTLDLAAVEHPKVPGLFLLTAPSHLRQVDRAAFAALVDAALDAGRELLVIVAHGGTQMAVMERYALPRRSYHDGCGPNAGGFVLEADRSVWRQEHTLRQVGTVQYTRAAREAGC